MLFYAILDLVKLGRGVHFLTRLKQLRSYFFLDPKEFGKIMESKGLRETVSC